MALAGSFTTSLGGSAGSGEASAAGGGSAGAAATPGSAPRPFLAGASARRSRPKRARRVRDSTLYGMRVTNSTPSGIRASRMIQVPTVPIDRRRLSDTAQPSTPPLCTRNSASVSEARARMPVALTRRIPSPTAACQPCAMRGRTNADTP